MKHVIFMHYAGPLDGYEIKKECNEFSDIKEAEHSEFMDNIHGYNIYDLLPECEVAYEDFQVRFYKWRARPAHPETITTNE